MFIIKLANLKIKINNNFSYLSNLCKDYIVDSSSYDFEISVSQEEIIEERISSNLDKTDGYIESICCYRKIANILPSFDAFVLHAAVVEVDGGAYGFLAKSGVGKTTHIKLWKKLLGNNLTFLNGDKPIIRIINNTPVAFGTPWCGKENYGTNTFAYLKSLTFIERSMDNKIEDLDKANVIKRLIHQVFLPSDEVLSIKTLDLLNQTILSINTYILYCNQDISSAELAYKKLKVLS